MHHVEPALRSLGGVFTRRDAQAAGISRWVLERLVRRDVVEHVAHGLYRCTTQTPDAEHRWERVHREHLARARQALRAHPGHALSHLSAALAWGWPVSIHEGSPVHLSALSPTRASQRLPGLVLHKNTSLGNETTTARGCLVLSAARTVADCLRVTPPDRGVPVADGAVRAGDTSEQEIRAVLSAQARWKGRPRALDALRLVDGRRESWLESFSFVRLHGLGVELPVPQVQVCDEHGVLVARVDGMWIADGVVAECDGAGKYLTDSKGCFGPDPKQAALRVVAEGKRERDIERLGLLVVRWGTDAITRHGESVAARVEDARRRGSITRFRGRLRLDGEWLDLPRPPFPSGHLIGGVSHLVPARHAADDVPRQGWSGEGVEAGPTRVMPGWASPRRPGRAGR